MMSWGEEVENFFVGNRAAGAVCRGSCKQLSIQTSIRQSCYLSGGVVRRSGDVGCCVDRIVGQLMRFGGRNAMEQRVYCITDDNSFG